MANKNYNKMSNNKKESKIEKTSIIEEVSKLEEPEIVEEITKPEEPINGIVSDCMRLNIRKKPDIKSDVVCVVDVDSKLLIVRSESTKEWFSVYAENGKKGYCMKKYITTN